MALAAPAQTPHALLWRVTAPDLEAPSYVLGTVHSPDARAYAHVAVALAAMDSCSTVAGELDFSAAPEELGAGLSTLMLPNGKSLKDLYSTRRYKKVRQAVGARLGPLLPLMDRIRPFYLMAMLEQGEQQGDSTRVLDQYLQDHAREQGKEVLGLERFQEQVDAVNDLPLDEQADMLYDAAVRKKSAARAMDRLLEAYVGQDLDELAATMSDKDLPAAVGTRLVSERNRVMVHRMDSLMRTGRACLFAVGAAHLPAADGVISGLRAKGYVLSPLPDVATLREEAVPAER